jgi:hypothetical protein
MYVDDIKLLFILGLISYITNYNTQPLDLHPAKWTMQSSIGIFIFDIKTHRFFSQDICG